jgi:hypothetical protein
MSDELKMDADALWRDETYTDQKVGMIRVLTPVTRDGGPDATRKVQYIGQASIYTPAGPLPINFQLDGDSLSAACAAFPEAAQKAVEETMEQLREMQRDQASKIVVPGAEEKTKFQLP